MTARGCQPTRAERRETSRRLGPRGFLRALAVSVLLSPLFLATATAARSSSDDRFSSSEPAATTAIHVSKARELAAAMDRVGYTLSAVRRSGKIPRFYVDRLPDDLSTLPTADRTELFLRIVLPAAAAANAQIEDHRSQVTDDYAKGRGLRAELPEPLRHLYRRYAVAEGDRTALLDRLDVIPISLTLAQAADESAWGQSRFALEGNALYGQHLAAGSTAPSLQASGASVRIAAFPSIQASTDAYIHTLNTTAAYGRLRSLRASLRKAGEIATGTALAGELVHYSERKDAYVRTLRLIISHHDLDSLVAIPLDTSVAPIFVRVGSPASSLSE